MLFPDFRKERHSVSHLVCHLVFVTKYRRKVFDDAAIDWLQGHFRKVCEGLGCDLIACDGEVDHVHVMLEYPPKLAVSVGRAWAWKSGNAQSVSAVTPEGVWEGSPADFASAFGKENFE